MQSAFNKIMQEDLAPHILPWVGAGVLPLQCATPSVRNLVRTNPLDGLTMQDCKVLFATAAPCLCRAHMVQLLEADDLPWGEWTVWKTVCEWHRRHADEPRLTEHVRFELLLPRHFTPLVLHDAQENLRVQNIRQAHSQAPRRRVARMLRLPWSQLGGGVELQQRPHLTLPATAVYHDGLLGARGHELVEWPNRDTTLVRHSIALAAPSRVETILTHKDHTAVVLQEDGRATLWVLPTFAFVCNMRHLGVAVASTWDLPYSELTPGQRIAYDTFGTGRCLVCFNAEVGTGLVVHESAQPLGWQRSPNIFRMATRPWHVEVNAERGMVYFIRDGRKGLHRWQYRTDVLQRLCNTETFLAFSISVVGLCAVAASHRVYLFDLNGTEPLGSYSVATLVPQPFYLSCVAWRTYSSDDSEIVLSAHTAGTPWRSFLLVMQSDVSRVVAVLPRDAFGFGSVLTNLWRAWSYASAGAVKKEDSPNDGHHSDVP